MADSPLKYLLQDPTLLQAAQDEQFSLPYPTGAVGPGLWQYLGAIAGGVYRGLAAIPALGSQAALLGHGLLEGVGKEELGRMSQELQAGIMAPARELEPDPEIYSGNTLLSVTKFLSELLPAAVTFGAAGSMASKALSGGKAMNIAELLGMASAKLGPKAAEHIAKHPLVLKAMVATVESLPWMTVGDDVDLTNLAGFVALDLGLRSYAVGKAAAQLFGRPKPVKLWNPWAGRWFTEQDVTSGLPKLLQELDKPGHELAVMALTDNALAQAFKQSFESGKPLFEFQAGTPLSLRFRVGDTFKEITLNSPKDIGLASVYFASGAELTKVYGDKEAFKFLSELFTVQHPQHIRALWEIAKANPAPEAKSSYIILQKLDPAEHQALALEPKKFVDFLKRQKYRSELRKGNYRVVGFIFRPDAPDNAIFEKLDLGKIYGKAYAGFREVKLGEQGSLVMRFTPLSNTDDVYLRVLYRPENATRFVTAVRRVNVDDLRSGNIQLPEGAIVEGAYLPYTLRHDPLLQARVVELAGKTVRQVAQPATPKDVIEIGGIVRKPFTISEVEDAFGRKSLVAWITDKGLHERIISGLYRDLVLYDNIFVRVGMDKLVERGELGLEQALVFALFAKAFESRTGDPITRYIKFTGFPVEEAIIYNTLGSMIPPTASGGPVRLRAAILGDASAALHEAGHAAFHWLDKGMQEELAKKAVSFIEYAIDPSKSLLTAEEKMAAEAYLALVEGMGNIKSAHHLLDKIAQMRKLGQLIDPQTILEQYGYVASELVSPFLAAAILREAITDKAVKDAVDELFKAIPNLTKQEVIERVKAGMQWYLFGNYELGRIVLEHLGIPLDKAAKELSDIERTLVERLEQYVTLGHLVSDPALAAKDYSSVANILKREISADVELFLSDPSMLTAEHTLPAARRRAPVSKEFTEFAKHTIQSRINAYSNLSRWLLDKIGLKDVGIEPRLDTSKLQHGKVSLKELQRILVYPRYYTDTLTFKVVAGEDLIRALEQKLLEKKPKVIKVSNDVTITLEKTGTVIEVLASLKNEPKRLVATFARDPVSKEMIFSPRDKLFDFVLEAEAVSHGASIIDALTGKVSVISQIGVVPEISNFSKLISKGLSKTSAVVTGIPSVINDVVFAVNEKTGRFSIRAKKPTKKEIKEMAQLLKLMGLDHLDLANIGSDDWLDLNTVGKMLRFIQGEKGVSKDVMVIAGGTDVAQNFTLNMLAHAKAVKETGKPVSEMPRFVIVTQEAETPKVEWLLGYPGTSADKWFKVVTDTFWERPGPAGVGIGRVPAKVASLVSMGYQVKAVKATQASLTALPEHAVWFSRFEAAPEGWEKALEKQFGAALDPRNMPVFNPERWKIDPDAWDQLARVAYSRGFELAMSSQTGRLLVYDLSTRELVREFESGAEALAFLESQPVVPSLVDPVTDAVLTSARDFWTKWSGEPPAPPQSAPVSSVPFSKRLQEAWEHIAMASVRIMFPMRRRLAHATQYLAEFIGKDNKLSEDPYDLLVELASKREWTLQKAAADVKPVIDAFEKATEGLTTKDQQRIGRVLSAALQAHVGIENKWLTAQEIQLRDEFFRMLESKGIKWRREYDEVLQKAREFFARSLEEIGPQLLQEDKSILWDYAMKVYAELGRASRVLLDPEVLSRLEASATLEHERRFARWDHIDKLSGLDHIVVRYANELMHILHMRPLAERVQNLAKEAEILAQQLEHGGNRVKSIAAMNIAAAMRYLHRTVEGLQGSPDSVTAFALAGAASAFTGKEVGLSKLTSMATTWLYTSVLGWRLKSPLVNLFTQYLILMPALGRYYGRAVKMWAKFKAGDASLQAYRDPVAMSFLRDYDEARRTIITRLRAAYPDVAERFLAKYADYALAAMRYTEEINRGVAYFGGIAAAEDVIAKAAKTQKTAQEWARYLMEQTPAALFDSQVVAALANQLERGSYREFALRFGEEMVRNTQWSYGPLEVAGFMESKVGRVAGMFGTWSSNYLAFLSKLANWHLLTGSPYLRSTLMRLMLLHAGAVAAFRALGIKRDDLFFLSPVVTYAGGPALTVVADAYDVVRLGGYERKIAYDRLARTLVGTMLAPQAIREHARTIHLFARGDVANALRMQVGFPQELSGPENAWRKRRLRREFERAVGLPVNAIFHVW